MKNQNHFFYLARCKDKSLYIGVSNNPKIRIERHNNGQGSLWIKQHGLAEIVYLEEYDSYLEAHRRELQIKKWRREKKENLIKYGKPILKNNNKK